MKPKVAIIYHSESGATEQLAHGIADGVVMEHGVNAVLCKVRSTDIYDGRYVYEPLFREIDRATAMVFGSPTYMGSVSAQFKSFIDASSERWSAQTWAGKLAAGFTIGSWPSGDQLSTIQYLQVLASQHSMLWIGMNFAYSRDPETPNRLGAQSGLITQCNRDGKTHAEDIKAAKNYGRRIAKYSHRLASSGQNTIAQSIQDQIVA